jgi:hypothetical protein
LPGFTLAWDRGSQLIDLIQEVRVTPSQMFQSSWIKGLSLPAARAQPGYTLD